MRFRDGAISVAVRVYAAALVLCPRRVRDEYAEDMRATFHARCRDGAVSAPALVALVFRELFDLALVALRSRASAASSFQAPSSSASRSASVNAILQDVRYALRLLCRQPGFTVVSMLTLALGIGATTAVFTVVEGVLLRPLPYAEPDRIVLLLNGHNGRLGTSFSPANHRDVTTGSGVFEKAAAFDTSNVNLTGLGDPQRLSAADVTGDFFSVLGLTARHGRLVRESDIAQGGQVVVLSDGLWRRRFGARPDVVGTFLRIDGKPYEAIGVAPAEARFPGAPDLWRPLMLTAKDLSDTQRGAQWIGGIARLKPGVTLEQANAAIAVVAERLDREYPRVNQGRQMMATPLQERMVQTVRPALLMLLGAVSLVLLIACVNVANLLLARGSGRAREVAVRAAVGAGRGRLVAQFLGESLVLGALGAAGGLAVAWGGIRALVALGPAGIPRLAEVGMDWRVLAFAGAVAIATSVLFGIVPALTSTGAALSQAMVASGRGGAVGPGGRRTQKTLVVCELALAVVLLVGAGLLIRSYQRLSGVNPGFSADRVLTFHLALPESKYPTAAAVYQAVSGYVERLEGTPGVEAAAAVFGLPLDSDFNASSSFTRPGEADTADSPSAGMRIVTPGYFAALKIPVRSGRIFDAHDDDAGAEVVVINEEAARRYWPDRNPIGESIKLGVRLASGVRSGQKTIVGVVGDVKYRGLDVAAPPEVYLPYAQHPVDSLTVAVRTTGEPAAVVPSARAALAALDPELPMADIRPMAELVGRSIAERRFTMLLLATFACLAVLLAAIGVYGVLAYVVSQRTQEIGLRLAIGAAPADVVRLFVREGATLAAVGLAGGLGGAAIASRALSTMLFGVGATDPLTFAGVAVALGAAALAASYLPARRAARVDPMEALRTD